MIGTPDVVWQQNDSGIEPSRYLVAGQGVLEACLVGGEAVDPATLSHLGSAKTSVIEAHTRVELVWDLIFVHARAGWRFTLIFQGSQQKLMNSDVQSSGNAIYEASSQVLRITGVLREINIRSVATILPRP